LRAQRYPWQTVSGKLAREVIDDALRALEPELGPPESEPVPLEGGITNRNYRVRFAGRDCVVRLPGKDTDLLGIDREAARAATMAAAEIGIGPDVVAFEPTRGCLVTGFIEARPVSADELRARIPEVAAALRAIHAGPPLPATFSPFERTARYERTARERGGSIPASYAEVRAAADDIAAVLDGASVPCHNDLLTANFLDDGERLRILDWEYAGMGDPFFDLANFSSHHELSGPEMEALLAAYFGQSTPARLASVRLMRIMAAFWEAMWGVVQATCSELDFDFLGYAEEHLAKVRASLADPDFPRWLEDARAA
jgi:thiamine kinase-like enzyme